jgi:two-component system sensor histidine kinase/response regulator
MDALTKDNIKILVAEDNLINQKVIRILLEKSGYKYELANDGIEALEKYNTGNYNLILMDCQMPNLDGLNAATKIREIESKNNKNRCPIVAMTANAMKGDRENCIAAGMDDFLSKPFKSFDLLKIIEIWGNK